MPERDDPDRTLDQLIDSALASYAEPRPGLEQRMIARISGEVAVPSRSRRWMLPAIAVPLAASLLLFAHLIPKRPQQQRVHIAEAPVASSPGRVEGTPAKHPSPISMPHAHNRSSKRLPGQVRSNVNQRPKLDIFPAPQPLSDAEQVVVRFASEASEANRKALVAPQRDFEEPIQITAIHIPPLPSLEEDTH